MKKTIILFCLTLLLAGCAANPQRPSGPPVQDETVPYAQENCWCGTLRGNGLLVPAHWSSLARLTEFYGPPAALVGGSSSSITMLILESILLNPYFSECYFSETSPEAYHEDVAFLLKTIEPNLIKLVSGKLAKSVDTLIEDQEVVMAKVDALRTKWEKGGFFNYLAIAREALFDKHISALRRIVFSKEFRMVVNTDFFIDYLKTNNLENKTYSARLSLTQNETQQVELTQDYQSGVAERIGQLGKALDNIGNYNALWDSATFFRPSLIRHEGLVTLFGCVADFYAGRGFDDYWTRTRFIRLMETCARGSRGKTWRQIVDDQPVCQEIMDDTARSWRLYYAMHKNELQQRVSEPISNPSIRNRFRAFPLTALLVGPSAEEYRRVKSAYDEDPAVAGPERFLADKSDFRIGYWGGADDLTQIGHHLKDPHFIDTNGIHRDFSSDERSGFFFPIGEASWREIIRCSTAEPGQGALQRLSDQHPDIISTGGWPNHNGAMVLNALGCPNIIQITRRDGVSDFGQNLAKRLFGLQGYEQACQEQDVGKTGLDNDMDSDWSRLYNLCNPKSSFNQALYVSDGIWCTDWDRYSLKRDERTGLIDDAYNADFYIPDPPWQPGRQRPSGFIRNGVKNAAADYQRILSTDERTIMDKQGKGYPEYAGCIPLVDSE